VCTAIVPFFNHEDQLGYAITALCLSAAFAGEFLIEINTRCRNSRVDTLSIFPKKIFLAKNFMFCLMIRCAREFVR
jgi:hypothetical protein